MEFNFVDLGKFIVVMFTLSIMLYGIFCPPGPKIVRDDDGNVVKIIPRGSATNADE